MVSDLLNTWNTSYHFIIGAAALGIPSKPFITHFDAVFCVEKNVNKIIGI